MTKNKKMKVSREVCKNKGKESNVKGLQERDNKFAKRACSEFVLGCLKGTGIYLASSSIPWEYLMKLCDALMS